MPNLKDIKNRIGSVKKTKQITSAMKLVAAARLKRATDAALAARPYREQLGNVLQRVATAAGDDIDEPLLKAREGVRSIQVVVLTSDRGLCGPFNNALLRRTQDWLEAKRDAGLDMKVRVYGRKGATFLKRGGWPIEDSVLNWTKQDKMEAVRPLTSAMVSGFLDGEHDETWLVYNRFVNTLVQTPTFERILPLSVEAPEAEAEVAGAGLAGDYRYEPASTEILSVLLPLYLRTLVLQTFLETEAGFYAAQMTAMENATRNASDLIDQLSLDYNRARQAAITTEIIEIVSGAAAL